MYSSNHKYTLFFLCAVFLCSEKMVAQDEKDTINDNVNIKGRYSFVLYTGGGWFTYAGSVGSAGTATDRAIVRTHPIGTFRIMWHPDHRLRIGLESGYTTFYSYKLRNGNIPGKVKLTGIPLLVVWSMAITKRINIFAGIGSYLLTTDLSYQGKVTSNAFSLGINAAVNYVQPLTKKLGIGAEIKWTEASQTKDYGVSAHLMLVWKFLEW